MWSGASRATFVKIAQQIGYSLPLDRRPSMRRTAFSTSRMDRTAMGQAQSDGKLTADKTTGEYTFTYSTTLPWLIWNEYHNANVEPDPSLFYRVIKEGPYNFQAVGARAFLRFADNVDLPSVRPFVCRAASSPSKVPQWLTKPLSINSASMSKTPCASFSDWTMRCKAAGSAFRTFGTTMNAWNSQAASALQTMKDMASAASRLSNSMSKMGGGAAAMPAARRRQPRLSGCPPGVSDEIQRANQAMSQLGRLGGSGRGGVAGCRKQRRAGWQRRGWRGGRRRQERPKG